MKDWVRCFCSRMNPQVRKKFKLKTFTFQVRVVINLPDQKKHVEIKCLTSKYDKKKCVIRICARSELKSERKAKISISKPRLEWKAVTHLVEESLLFGFSRPALLSPLFHHLSSKICLKKSLNFELVCILSQNASINKQIMPSDVKLHIFLD